MQDLDNRKTLATKCKGETPIKKKKKYQSKVPIYYEKEHVNFWSYGSAAATSWVMAGFQFNWRYVTYLPSFHIHTVYKHIV